MENTIRVNGESLRKMVKSAISFELAHGTVDMQYSTCIKVHDGIIYVCANNLSSAYKASTECRNDGDMEIIINDSTVKKLLNVKGNNLTLTHESGEKVLTVSDGKKKMSLHCYEPDGGCDFESYTLNFNHTAHGIFDIECAEFLNAVKTAQTFTAKDERRPILQGFLFDSENLVTIDGYRMCVKHLNVNKLSDQWKFVANAQLTNVKNVFDKTFGKISAEQTEDGKHTIFTANDGEIYVNYSVRNYEGDFHNWRSSMPKEYKAEFSVTAGNICEMAKEYKSYISAKDKRPFILGTLNGKMYGYIETNDVRVSQEIDVENLSGIDIFTGYNVEYTLDCFGVFDKKEKVQCRYNGDLSPLLISNGEYDILLLPVNLGQRSCKEEEKEKFENRIKNFKETSAA